MALNFPSSPTLGQVYTSGDKSWVWNGTSWASNSTGLSGYSGWSGFSGAAGASGGGGGGASNIINATSTTASQTTYVIGVTTADANSTPYVSVTNPIYFDPSTGTVHATNFNSLSDATTRRRQLLR